MRKRLITPTPENIRTRDEGWLDVERAAVVEVTSEDKDFPVEAAFVSGDVYSHALYRSPQSGNGMLGFHL
jgi:hypothetical protein